MGQNVPRMLGRVKAPGERGERTAVLEDLFDRALVRAREKEPRESLAFVKRRFASRKGLSAGG